MESAATLITFIPFIMILFAANGAERRRERGEDGTTAAALAYGLLILMYLTFVFFGAMLALLSMISQTTAAAQMGIDTATLADLGNLAPALWIPSIAGLILLLPPVRRLLARVLPIDAASTVHAVALSYIALVVLNTWLTVAFGLGNLSRIIEQTSTDSTTGSIAATVWTQALLFIVLSMIGVGWPTRRSVRQTGERLAIVMPSGRQVAIGLLVGLGLAAVSMAASWAIDQFGLGNSEVDRLSDLLVGPLTVSLVGVLTLGVGAAIGEECLFRGALQPRFGLILTTLVFALMHSQYGFSAATLIVFLVGLVLGLVRRSNNTSTSMICHATYNIGLVLLAGLLGL